MKAPLFLALIALWSYIAQPAIAGGPEKAPAGTPEAVQTLTAEELELQASLERFFEEQYSHTAAEQPLRQVQVFAADGRLIKKFRTTNGQIPARKLPKGAERLMEENGIAYYMITR